jgi:hypothetical protein
LGWIELPPRLSGLAWAHRELTVRFIIRRFMYFLLSQLFEYEEQSLRILFHLPIADVRHWHAAWLDHDSEAIFFEVANSILSFFCSASTEYRRQERVEVYRMKHVNADNEDDSSNHRDEGWHPQHVELSKTICKLPYYNF